MNKEPNGQRTLILGATDFSYSLALEIRANPHSGYRVIGMVAERDGSPEQSHYPVLGTMAELRDIIARTEPDRIIVTISERSGFAKELVEARFFRNIDVDDGVQVFERLTGKLAIDSQTQAGMLFSDDFNPSRFSLLASRAISLLFATIGIVVLAPLLLLIAIAIKLDSPGPVLFVQTRIGLSCKSFRLYKFRTMHPQLEKTSEWAADNGHRVTRVGRWLRKFRLDELPQFVNIIANDMNLVGPRPHPSSNYELFALVARNTPECGEQIPFYSMRSMVLPGITGWAQVRYQYANSLIEEIEKLRFDLYYVKHYSLWLDLRIVFETMKVVLLGQEGPKAELVSETSRIGSGPFRPLPVQQSTAGKSAVTLVGGMQDRRVIGVVSDKKPGLRRTLQVP